MGWFRRWKWEFSRKNLANPLDKAFIFTKAGIPLLYSKSTYRLIEKILSREILDELSNDDKIVFHPISNDDLNKLFKWKSATKYFISTTPIALQK